MPEATISASAVTYRAGGRALVSAVDLEAHNGELLAVIGPNGAGKSTLLALLAGDLMPDEGTVFLDGVDVGRALPGDLSLVRAMLTQRNPIDIPYTAAEVVAMGRFPHRRLTDNSPQRDAAAVAEAMGRTATDDLAARTFSTLSAGERTRVSLARVLAQQTPIVLLDEPTTALDVAHQERVMRETRRLAREERTVVVVLHDLNAAARYADRIVIMHGGAIAAAGAPRDVLRAALLSSVYAQPMAVVDHPLGYGLLVLVDETPPGITS